MAQLDLSSVLLVISTALLLSLITITQFVATYASNYVSAPRELAVFTSYLDASIQENESYDVDISSLSTTGASLKDKMRLSLLLQEIQKCGDDMREDLMRLLVEDFTADKDGSAREGKLKKRARLLWGVRKRELEDRVRRIDVLRLRFLVVYMGVVASSSTRPNRLPTPPITPDKQTAIFGRTPESKSSRSLSLSSSSTDSTDTTISSTTSSAPRPRPGISHALTDGIIAGNREGRRPLALRRLNTQAMGHNDNSGGGQRMGWLGVVQELQRSPVMRERHASIERSGGERPNIAGVFAGLP